MTELRISFFVLPLLLAAEGCSGGPGRTVDVTDPDAPPALSDRPPAIANQNPASASRPPDNSQPPTGTTSKPTTPPGGTDCVSLCMTLPAYGCQTPDNGCTEGCAELMTATCGPQIFALERCALSIACPEELEDPSMALLEQIAAMCPSQYQAFLTCAALNQ